MRKDLLETVAEHTDLLRDGMKCTSVGGGSINHAFKVEDATSTVFVKVNSASRYPEMFEKEREGLNLLRSSNAFDIPSVIAIAEKDGNAFLIMEYVTQGAPGNAFNRLFAQRLAKLHASSTDEFGLDHDNYIGSLVQQNHRHDDWSEFFLNERLLPLVKMASDRGLLSTALMDKVATLGGVIDELFPTCSPRLLHGDLWSGNYMVNADGEPVIIDPAVYYGHPYMDLGMMQLFGGYDQDIFRIYAEIMGLDSSWKQGAEFANLYPLLVHVNLFGEGYVRQFRSIIDRYIS